MCCRRSLSEYWLCQADQFLQSLCWCIHAYCYFVCFGHLLSIPLLWILSWTWLTYSRCKHETLLSYIDAATVCSKLFCVKFHNRSGFIKKLNNNNVNQDLGKNLSFQPRKILTVRSNLQRPLSLKWGCSCVGPLIKQIKYSSSTQRGPGNPDIILLTSETTWETAISSPFKRECLHYSTFIVNYKT